MKGLRPLVGLLVSLSLLWLLFRATDFRGLVQSLQAANYLALVPAVAVYFAGVWLRSARWRLLLRPVAVVPAGRLFRATIIGFAVNDLTPVRLGELARAFLLARWASVPPAATIGTIVVERLFDGLTLCALLGFVWLNQPLGGWLVGAALLATGVFVAGTIGATLAAFQPRLLLALARAGIRLLPHRFRAGAVHLATTFLDGLRVLRQGRVLVLTTLLSLGAWLTEATMYYLIMRGFNFDAGPIASLLAMVAANLGTMLPSMPGFVGTFDAPLQGVLTDVFHVEQSLATSYTLVVHAALFAPVVVIGLLLLWREGLSLADVSRRKSAPPHAVGTSTDPAPRAL